MKKKSIWFVSLALTGIVLFAGCSGKKQASGGGGSSGQPVTITLWHYFASDQENAGLKKFADDFKIIHPEVTMDITFISREELMNQYTVGAVSGQLPDIGMVDSPDMSSYVSLGVFADITDELNAWGELDKFYPGPLSSTRDSNGRIHGLPNNTNCLALACNMNMLRAAGLEKPVTWDDLETAAARLTNPAEQIYGFAMSVIPNEEGTFQVIPWIYAAGGSVTNLASPEAIRGIEFIANLAQKGYMSKEVVNWTQGDAFNAFAAGKAAMVESGTWHVAQNVPDIKDFEVEYTLLPKDKKYASVIGGENFGICSTTKNKELAVEFLKMISGAESVAFWAEQTGKLPIRSDSALLRDIWTKDKYLSVFTDGMNYAVARGPHPEWPAISKVIYSSAQAAVLGQAPARDSMTQGAAAIAPILQETPIAE
ncbi:MAG: sugar ABC transporter substrate-binding protein [Treponema sp.]|jgi:multiple sugar transport system substrate-binding protein|nr:sugar ABC transporter substrate-binding protein [Treponema sp.]